MGTFGTNCFEIFRKRALSKVFFRGFQEVDIIHPEGSSNQICMFRIVMNLLRPVLCKLQLTFISTRRQILGLWGFWVHLKWLENESVSNRWFKKAFSVLLRQNVSFNAMFLASFFSFFFFYNWSENYQQNASIHQDFF